jgi:hypothetical protein
MGVQDVHDDDVGCLLMFLVVLVFGIFLAVGRIESMLGRIDKAIGAAAKSADR